MGFLPHLKWVSALQFYEIARLEVLLTTQEIELRERKYKFNEKLNEIKLLKEEYGKTN